MEDSNECRVARSLPGLPPRCEALNDDAERQNLPCSVCDGTGERGVFGTPGLGLVRRPCPACSSNGTYVTISLLKQCSGGAVASRANDFRPEVFYDSHPKTLSRTISVQDEDDRMRARSLQRDPKRTSDLLPSQSHKFESVQPSSAATGLGCRTFSATTGTAVVLNVYWMRKVAFNEQGRIERNTTSGKLTWGRKFVKDLLGIYHVGLEIHSAEYTYGNYHAPESKKLGGAASGVHRHQPQRPGPRYSFKEAVDLGTTTLSAAQVEDTAEHLGRTEFASAAYDRIRHNCVDFVRELAEMLGAGDLPFWCHRGAAAARLLDAGSSKLKNSAPVQFLGSASCRSKHRACDEEELRF